jgi:hypothetical protein
MLLVPSLFVLLQHLLNLLVYFEVPGLHFQVSLLYFQVSLGLVLLGLLGLVPRELVPLGQLEPLLVPALLVPLLLHRLRVFSNDAFFY